MIKTLDQDIQINQKLDMDLPKCKKAGEYLLEE